MSEETGLRGPIGVQDAPEGPEPAPAIQKRAASMPGRYRAEYLRVVTGTAVSRRSAMRQFCLECCGYDFVAVRECTAVACPLWRLRPYQQARA